MRASPRVSMSLLAVVLLSTILEAQGNPEMVDPEVCEALASLGDDWNGSADLLDEGTRSGLDQNQADQINLVMAEATEETRWLADSLLREGSDFEVDLGEALHDALP